MVAKLLVYTRKQNVFGLDEKIPPQHYGHLHTSNLHKWIINFATNINTCFQNGNPYMDYINHQIIDWELIGTIYWFQDELL